MASRNTAFGSSILSILLLGSACSPKGPASKPALELTGRVVDAANLLSAAETKLLTAKLAALETHHGEQFVVATTPSLNGQDINRYSLTLANNWGLGSKERNDGLLLLVAPNERRVRIEVGLGLEKTLPNALCSKIIQERIAPEFRQGHMAAGINAGVDALIEALEAPTSNGMEKAA